MLAEINKGDKYFQISMQNWLFDWEKLIIKCCEDATKCERKVNEKEYFHVVTTNKRESNISKLIIIITTFDSISEYTNINSE